MSQPSWGHNAALLPRVEMPLPFPHELRTQRLLLKRWRRPDAPLLKAAIDANLAHLQRWMPWARDEPSPLEVIEARIERFETEFDDGKEWLFAIRSRAGDVLGGTGLHPRIGPGGVEIGYWLQESATGQGFATEAVEAMTRLALQQPEFERVEIRCDPRNAPSAAVPRRLGYRHTRTIENETAPTGELRDTMVWEMTRANYSGNRE
ncbi:MAG: GNAT family N-acetyltransferase [Burkholderiales bacterium]